MTQNGSSGIYFFLGNISSHVLHALPLYKKIGGTFVTTSNRAKSELEAYGLPTICLDDVPYVWKWQGKRPHRIHEYTKLDQRFKKTVDFLDEHAEIIIFYELFEFSNKLAPRKPKKIFLTHGNMLKNYFEMYPRRLEIVKQYDYMAALGPFMKQEFIRSGIDKQKLIDIGIARTDEVVALAGKVVISDKLKRFELPPNKPIVSYLPTFWGDSSIESLGVEILENISDEYTVLFRPHPQTPKKILDGYKSVVSRKNVFLFPENNPEAPSLLDVYAASSVIIGDLSSVMLEAILLDKPLIFANPTTTSGVGHHNQIDDISAFCNHISKENVKDVNGIISTSIKSGVDYQIWEEAKRRCFFNYDGTSVDSIAEFLRSITNN